MEVKEKREALIARCEDMQCCDCMLSHDETDYHDVCLTNFEDAPDEMIEHWYAMIFPYEHGLNAIYEPVIKDSGARHQFFEGGGVRDIQKGKGRCDLIPLDIAAEFMECTAWEHRVVQQIAKFQETADRRYLHLALSAFLGEREWRTPEMILEVAIHFENGMEKYGQDNWKNGLPLHSYISSSIRHYFKWQRGDKDEPHDRAFCWNILCAIWTCKHKPELNDYEKKVE